MGKHRTRTALAAAIVLMSTCLASQAFAWGSATHAYICDHIGKGDRYPLQNLNEIYGGMAPDVFAYLFDYPELIDIMYWMTHYDAPPQGVPIELPSYMDVWRNAKTVLGKAAAWGFLSHNGETGADATAHGHYDYTNPDAYIISKAVMMAKQTSYADKLLALKVEGRLLFELCHIFIESAVDIKLAEVHHNLGIKISTAALSRTPEFSSNFAETYSKALKQVSNLLTPSKPISQAAAAQVIRRAENDFRTKMISYGYALAQENSKQLVAENLADVALDYLQAYGIPIVGIPPEMLSELAFGLLMEAYQTYTQDYSDAVEYTVSYVKANIK